MAGLWQRAMGYLGLNDDDSYDYEPYDEQPAPPTPRRSAAPSPNYGSETVSAVRAVPAQTSDSGVGAVVPQRPAVLPGGGSGSVRTITPVPVQHKVHVVSPASFAEAQEIGERFRSSQPVIMNLTAVDRDLARRLVDFASGLAYGLNGAMKKISDKVFMLTPADYEVSADEKRRLRETGLLRS
jgi:cell division inhibitor SepF